MFRGALGQPPRRSKRFAIKRRLLPWSQPRTLPWPGNIGIRAESVDEQIEAVAKRFRVSEETIARRLLDGGVISQPEYDGLRADYAARWREHKDQASSRGDYYRNALARNGRLYTLTVFSARYSGEITIRDACVALGVKANNLSQLAETAGLMPTAHHGGGG